MNLLDNPSSHKRFIEDITIFLIFLLLEVLKFLFTGKCLVNEHLSEFSFLDICTFIQIVIIYFNRDDS